MFLIALCTAGSNAFIKCHIFQIKFDKNTKKKAEEEAEADKDKDASKNKVPGFWTDVDEGLDEVRQETHGVEEATSRYVDTVHPNNIPLTDNPSLFTRSLTDNLALYGKVPLDHLTIVLPHTLE